MHRGCGPQQLGPSHAKLRRIRASQRRPPDPLSLTLDNDLHCALEMFMLMIPGATAGKTTEGFVARDDPGGLPVRGAECTHIKNEVALGMLAEERLQRGPSEKP